MTFDTGYSTPPLEQQQQPPPPPSWSADVPERPAPPPLPKTTSSTTDVARASSIPTPVDLERNAWADDDEFGHEKEMHMTFE